MILVVMGVSGAGKSTVGAALAKALGWPFLEADELHSPANIDKMRRGEPLDDADRAPWLQAVAARMRDLQDGVVACSALRERYRAVLRVRDDVKFVFLDVPRAALGRRLAHRKGHYMPPSLLPSQLGTLERPDAAVTIEGELPIAATVAQIRSALQI
ncbi:MAG TPA: gluconokinase [Polyangia bacterium]|jgi:gluconokinase|nr:gluconokinase [Polyangia bacterium]